MHATYASNFLSVLDNFLKLFFEIAVLYSVFKN